MKFWGSGGLHNARHKPEGVDRTTRPQEIKEGDMKVVVAKCKGCSYTTEGLVIAMPMCSYL